MGKDKMDNDRERRRDLEMDGIWEAIGRLDIDPSQAGAAGQLTSGRTVYGFVEGLAPGEMLKEYPDGRKEVVRIEGGDNPKEIFVRVYSEPEK